MGDGNDRVSEQPIQVPTASVPPHVDASPSTLQDLVEICHELEVILSAKWGPLAFYLARILVYYMDADEGISVMNRLMKLNDLITHEVRGSLNASEGPEAAQEVIQYVQSMP